MTTEIRARKRSRSEELADQIADLAMRAKLDSWTSFVEELQVPSDVYPALLTLRPQLMRAVTPRALTAEECAALYKLIAGLIETNAALREHAEGVAQLVGNWLTAFGGLNSIGRQIGDYANFRNTRSLAKGDDESEDV